MQTLTNSITGKIILVNTNAFSEKMTWKDATTACKNLGVGWRLPTREELRLICSELYDQSKGNLLDTVYWSSELLSPNLDQRIIDEMGMAYVMDMRCGIILPPKMVFEELQVCPIKDFEDTEFNNKMVKVEYRCRSCFYGSCVPEVIFTNDNKYPLKSGHSEVFAGEKLREFLNTQCPECGSLDIEYFNIQIDSIPLFNEEKFKYSGKGYIEIYIVKENDKLVKASFKGAQNLGAQFKQKLLTRMYELKNEILQNNNSNHSFGNLHFVYRGFTNSQNVLVCRTERFLNAGISSKESIPVINNVISAIQGMQ